MCQREHAFFCFLFFRFVFCFRFFFPKVRFFSSKLKKIDVYFFVSLYRSSSLCSGCLTRIWRRTPREKEKARPARTGEGFCCRFFFLKSLAGCEMRAREQRNRWHQEEEAFFSPAAAATSTARTSHVVDAHRCCRAAFSRANARRKENERTREKEREREGRRRRTKETMALCVEFFFPLSPLLPSSLFFLPIKKERSE